MSARLAARTARDILCPGSVRHVQHESVKAAGLSHWQVVTSRHQVRYLETAVTSRSQ